MTGKELREFRIMVGISQAALGVVLGYGRRNIQLFEDSGKVRNGVALACAAYALGIVQYDGPAAKAQWERRKEA